MENNEDFYNSEVFFSNKYNIEKKNKLEDAIKINDTKNKYITHKFNNCKKRQILQNQKLMTELLYFFIFIIYILRITADDYIYFYTSTYIPYIFVHNLKGYIYDIYYYDNRNRRYYLSWQTYSDNKTIRISMNSYNNVQIQLNYVLNNASQMFKDCQNIRSIDLSSFYSSSILYTNEMFENCTSLEYINFGNFYTSNVVNMSRMFYNCSSLTKLNFNYNNFNTIKVTDMSYMFTNCINLSEIISLERFNTIQVTNMSYMFSNCSKLLRINLNNFKTDAVTNMSYMFYNCSGLSELNLNTFNTSSVTDMKRMFSDCTNLTKVNLDNFNSNKVTDMSHMFSNCFNLKEINMENFNTYEVNDMSYMFSDCKKLNEINLMSFNTPKVKNLKNMFENCINMESLKQKFITSSVTNMEFMFNNCQKLKSIDISNFDLSSIESMNSIFKDCQNINPIKFPSIKKSPFLTDMASMFSGCASLVSLDLTNFDTSQVEFMQELFKGCKSLEYLDISTFDTINVIQMESMFENCITIKNISLKNFYTPNLKQIYNMFYNCISLTSIDISNFDTYQITNFANLFYNCYSLTSVNLNSFITYMVYDMSYMFYNCSSLSVLDLTNFDTIRVIRMNSMFEDCSLVNEIKINEFINTKTTDMNRMFYGCKNLTTINLDKFFTSQVVNMNSMFHGCASLLNLNVTNFITNKVINMNSLFYGCSSVEYIYLSDFNTINVKDMANMFSGCESLVELNITNFKTINLEKTGSMFRNCKQLKFLSLSSFDTANVVSMKSMFYGCNSLEEIDLEKINTNGVIYMDEMFYGCSSLIKLNLNNFDFTNVKNLGYMFYGCKSLAEIILPSMKNLIVSNTSYMFAGCSSIIELDLSNFDTSNVISFDYMFSECVFLKKINLDKWNTKRVKSMNYMFAGCSSLTSLNILGFETPLLESIKGMFYGCSSLTYLDLSKLNTSSVTNTEYMFYKASSLISINFILPDYIENSNETEINTYFDTSLVTNMRYMFAYCSKLEEIDLGFFKTANVSDMSYMFEGCDYLTSVNLSSFNTSKVFSMKNMFYNDYNLVYINLFNTIDLDINIDNIFENTPINGIFCIDEIKGKKIYDEIINTKKCYVINCNNDLRDCRKRIDFETKKCMDDCRDELKFEYQYTCYKECPNNTYEVNFKCIPLILEKEDCNIQKVFLSECEIYDLPEIFNNTNEDKIMFIDRVVSEIKNFKFEEVIKKLLKGEEIIKNIFNEKFYISLLSNRNKINDLVYIDILDCENFLKAHYKLGEIEEIIILMIEYKTNEFKIPIIEYKLFSEYSRKELSISVCNSMKFTYSIPARIDKDKLFKHDPKSEYNNEICYKYKTENNTDIILFDRRNTFNEDYMALCENNCSYLGYEEGRVKCECEVNPNFNKFLYANDSERDNYIIKLTNNKISKYNFIILKCFKMFFTLSGFGGNIPGILYISLIFINIILALVFCLRGYKTFYDQIQWLSYRELTEKHSKKKKKNINIAKIENPPKIKKNKSTNPVLKINKIDTQVNQEDIEKGSKVNAPSSLIDSRNVLKKGMENNLVLNKEDNNLENDWDEFLVMDKDMEINFMSYSEAIKSDKRNLFEYYFSLLKSRHLIISIFINDYNILVIKIGFLLYIFGLSIGVSTIFFNDISIQKIYEAKGTYTYLESISYHMIPILMSAAILIIIKTITSLIIHIDRVILNLKGSIDLKREEKKNTVLIKIMSRSVIFYILYFIFLLFFWIYAGIFCSVFKNSQLYLIINGIMSFVIVLILPFLFYFIPALFRSLALKGKNNQCLYKFSQIIQLI